MQIDVDPEQDFHVVIGGAATALSLDALAEAYEADRISDETLIWQQGFDEWMRLDILLAALSEQEGDASEAPSASDQNNYLVQVASEDVRSMTLEALVEAYRLGRVQEETLVFGPGRTEWVSLSVVIASFEAPPPAASLAPTPQLTQRPSVAAASAAPSLAPGPNVAPAASAAPASSLAPAPSLAPAFGVAPSAPPSAPNSLVPTSASIGPMRAGGSTVADLGLDDLEMQAFRSSRSPWLTRSLMAVGALAAVFAIYQGTGGSVDEEAAQPGGVSVRTASAAVAPAVEEEPSAWEKEQAMLKEADRLDDAATKAQAAAFGASLAGESKEKKAPAAAAKRKWRPKAKKAAVSKSAANTEYDPMNGSL